MALRNQIAEGCQAMAISEIATKETATKALSTKDPEALKKTLMFLGSKGEGLAAQLDYGDAVAKCLGNKNADVVAAACEALGNMGSIGATYADYIVNYTKNDSQKVKTAAVMALGQFGPVAGKHSAAIVRVVDSSSETEAVKAVAIQALGLLKATDKADLISKFLTSESPELSSAACQAMGCLGQMGEQKVGDIAKLLSSSGNDGKRYAAICSLRNLGPKFSAKYVDEIASNCLADPDAMTRIEAVMTIGKMGEAANKIIGKARDLLSHQDPAIRATAACTLGAIGVPAAGQCAADVAKLLDDNEEDDAYMALCVGGGSSRLARNMRKPKCGALVALGAMQSAQHLDKIAVLLKSEDWEVRVCALEALALLGPQAIDAAADVAGCFEDDTFFVRAKAATAIAALKADEYMPMLPELFKDDAQLVRVQAVTALGEFGELGAQCATEAFPLLMDSTGTVRAAAAKAMTKFGEIGMSYAGPICTLLNDPEPIVRCEAVVALSKMGYQGQACVEEIQALLDDPVAQVRYEAMQILQEFGVEDANKDISGLKQLTEASSVYISTAEKEKMEMGL